MLILDVFGCVCMTACWKSVHLHFSHLIQSDLHEQIGLRALLKGTSADLFDYSALKVTGPTLLATRLPYRGEFPKNVYRSSLALK